MMNPFVLKLDHGVDLTREDKASLNDAISDIRQVPAREDIIVQGARPDEVHIVLEGFACRYKLLSDGGRQIMAYLVPGDACDLRVSILGEMDHSIATLSACKIGMMPSRTVDELSRNHRINRALWWATLVDEGILREWLVGLGRRSADKRLAHLFCELLVRLDSVGLATERRYEFPVTQAEIGDTLGLSTVHVNRTLQDLRADNLLSFDGRQVVITDVARLNDFAEFDPNYLHLKKRSQPAGGWETRRETVGQ